LVESAGSGATVAEWPAGNVIIAGEFMADSSEHTTSAVALLDSSCLAT